MSDNLSLSALTPLLDDWAADAPARAAFITLRDHLAGMPHAQLTVHARPGVSWSLRASVGERSERPLFAMVDVVDDDPAERWLSVCFYDDMITDADERGDCIPKGLLGCDARCFNIEEADEDLVAYVAARLSEARDSALATAR